MVQKNDLLTDPIMQVSGIVVDANIQNLCQIVIFYSFYADLFLNISCIDVAN